MRPESASLFQIELAYPRQSLTGLALGGVEPMYCIYCGGNNPDGAKFCNACGQAFPSVAAPQSTAAVGPAPVAAPPANPPAAKTTPASRQPTPLGWKIFGTLMAIALLFGIFGFLYGVASRITNSWGVAFSQHTWPEMLAGIVGALIFTVISGRFVYWVFKHLLGHGN